MKDRSSVKSIHPWPAKTYSSLSLFGTDLKDGDQLERVVRSKSKERELRTSLKLRAKSLTTAN